MKWWNDLWLNEGFSTWVSCLAINNIPKEIINWNVWPEFIMADIESGMRHDFLKNFNLIAETVNKLVDISRIFYTISYSKGSIYNKNVRRLYW